MDDYLHHHQRLSETTVHIAAGSKSPLSASKKEKKLAGWCSYKSYGTVNLGYIFRFRLWILRNQEPRSELSGTPERFRSSEGSSLGVTRSKYLIVFVTCHCSFRCHSQRSDEKFRNPSESIRRPRIRPKTAFFDASQASVQFYGRDSESEHANSIGLLSRS